MPDVEAVEVLGAGATNRVLPLDGLRGIAMLAVLVIHFEAYAAPWARLLPPVYLVFSRNLWIGVDLFFVLSGFLITGILLDARSEPLAGALRSFYMRRVLRIFPLYYFVVIVAFVAVPLWEQTPLILQDMTFLSHLTFSSNLLQAARGHILNGWVAIFWSLAIEEQFYLFWPWIVRSLETRSLQRVCLAVLALSPVLRLLFWVLGANSETLYVFTPLRLDGLAAGAFLAVAIRNPAQRSFLSQRAGPTLAIASTLYLLLIAGSLAFPIEGTSFPGFGMNYFWHQPIIFTIGYTVVSIGFSALTLLVLESHGPLRTLLSNKLLTGAGRFSFSIYLIHVIIGLLLTEFWLRHGFFSLGTGFRSLTVYVLCFGILVTAVALTTWELIEKPSLRLTKLFPYKSAA